ncbi:MAG: Xaa-Pro peptidase family protein [Pirellulales bacterium]
MDPYAINEAACRGRQRKFLAEISQQDIELAVVTGRETIQWLTGALVRAPYEPVAVLRADGHCLLVLPERQIGEAAAVDEKLGYPAKLHSTLVDDQRAASSETLKKVLTGRIPKRLGVEFATFSPHLTFLTSLGGSDFADVGPVVSKLRRYKDADQLAMHRRANDANQAMYERAREIVQPGANEIEIYNELAAVAVRTLGEPLTYFGQDFRSAARGGAPRNRAIEAGELYIFDLGVGFRGYYSDNCRTLAVGGQPTELQQKAWNAVSTVFQFIEANVQPGVSCKMLFDTVQKQLDAYQPWFFNHHLGHGVGLSPQEGPHLNPCWDDHFAEGDYIAVEPGLYHDDLRYGVRLEQNYLVTATGVELLTPWPLGLV